MISGIRSLIRRNEVVIQGRRSTERPCVSVLIQTFNHEATIAQCVESVLAQETPFPFEVIVGDDGSSDGTVQAIAKAVAGDERVRVGTFRVNLGARTGNGRINFFRNLERSSGDYVALLSGDDYWVDPERLARHVEILTERSDLGGVFGNIVINEGADYDRVFYVEGERSTPQLPIPPTLIDRHELMVRKWIHMSAFTFRADAKARVGSSAFFKFRWGDTFIPLAVAEVGDILFEDRIVSSYRFNGKGIWSSLSEVEKARNHLTDVYLRARTFGVSEMDRESGMLALKRLRDKHGYTWRDLIPLVSHIKQMRDFEIFLNGAK